MEQETRISDLEDDSSNPSMAAQYVSKQAKTQYRRNLVAFWLFGLTNNFAYVVMLSAAHDILDKEEENGKNSTDINTTTLSPITNSSSLFLECNEISTGAILLADILPALFTKMTFPFFMQQIPYRIRIGLIAVLGAASFVMVAFAHELWLGILGVVCASFGSGLGEITFLSLTTFYHRNVVSMWSSGTGGAGVFGALVYAGFTSAGLSPRNSLLIMITVPVLMMISYVFILMNPVKDSKKDDEESAKLIVDEQKPAHKLSLREKIRLLPFVLKFILPLSVVYFAEYFINQGLHELLYFNGEFLSKKEQYRWFQVDYQIGVFISRSSVNLIHIRQIWMFPVFQLINMAFLICQVFYRFIPNMWIVLAIILWEGMLGGGAYVNTFYKMTNEIKDNIKEYCIGVATLGDSIGIAIAGAIAIPSHNSICKQNIRM